MSAAAHTTNTHQPKIQDNHVACEGKSPKLAVLAILGRKVSTCVTWLLLKTCTSAIARIPARQQVGISLSCF
jgi:hypothetical protein